MNNFSHIEPEISFFRTISVTVLCNRRTKAGKLFFCTKLNVCVSSYCRAKNVDSCILATVSGFKNYGELQFISGFICTEHDSQNQLFEPTHDRMN